MAPSMAAYREAPSAPRPSCYVLLTALSSSLFSAHTSWVRGRQQQYSLTRCRWVDDDVFGRVLRCSRADEDLIILDPVSYGAPLQLQDTEE